jgi:hypothetical protein
MKKLALIALSLPLATASCGRSEPSPPPTTVAVAPPTTTMPAPLSVSVVTLGKEIGPDKKAVAAVETFAVKDTIYAVVDTTGAGRGKLRAVWSFMKGGKATKVDETTIDIDATGPAVNEFHISKPTGWPKGDYKVDIYLNDAAEPSMSKTFKVA